MTGQVCITDSEYADTSIEEEVLGADGVAVRRAACTAEDDVVAAARGAAGLLVQYAPITRHVLESLPELRVVARYGTGYDNVDVDAATERGVWVTNVPVYGTDEVAVHTVALLLAVLRGLPRYDAARADGSWPPPAQIAPHTGDLAFGVAGVGRIGRRVLELAGPMFAAAHWFDPLVDADVPGATRHETFDGLLAVTNVLSLHLPLTEETRGFVNYERMAAMPAPRIVVNAARGPLIVQADLERALADGTLFGAGMDVFETEPLGARHPLLSFPNLAISPHAAWASTAALVDVRRRAADNVAAVLRGRRPPTPVNDPGGRK